MYVKRDWIKQTTNLKTDPFYGIFIFSQIILINTGLSHIFAYGPVQTVGPNLISGIFRFNPDWFLIIWTATNHMKSDFCKSDPDHIWWSFEIWSLVHLLRLFKLDIKCFLCHSKDTRDLIGVSWQTRRGAKHPQNLTNVLWCIPKFVCHLSSLNVSRTPYHHGFAGGTSLPNLSLHSKALPWLQHGISYCSSVSSVADWVCLVQWRRLALWLHTASF